MVMPNIGRNWIGLAAGGVGVVAIVFVMGFVNWGSDASGGSVKEHPLGATTNDPANRTAPPPFPQAPYELVKNGLPEGGEWRGRPAVADLNGDGALDIVCSVRKADGLFAFLNDGTGRRYQEAIQGLPRNAGYGGSAVADFDKDGFADIVFSTHGAPIQVYAGNGKGSWRRHTKGLANVEIATDVAVGDVDHDGDVDVVSVAWASGGLWYHENEKGESWKSRQVFTEDTDMFGKAVELIDVDGDSHLDVVATYFGPRVFKGDGKGGFGKPDASSRGLVQPLTGGVFLGLATPDFDRDGRPEIVASSMAIEGLLGLYAYRFDAGKGEWVETGAGLPKGETIHGFDFGDLDKDGHVDAVLSSERGVVLYYGDGRGGFSRPEVLDGSSKTAEIVIADMNGDGLGDILEVYCYRPGGVRVWLRKPAATPPR
jgi:hypothetical protein